ncbi:hypothetical protein K5549_014517 [Capra hircus]|nr:hypothetical protein K5549_014517 [Capra hircus]
MATRQGFRHNYQMQDSEGTSSLADWILKFLCPRPGATCSRVDWPGDSYSDQSLWRLTGGQHPGKSSSAPGRHAYGADSWPVWGGDLDHSGSSWPHAWR